MTNNRKITLSLGNSRRSINWQPASMMLSDFYEKLRSPYRSHETLSAFMNLPKREQDELKDSQGGFVGGSLNSPRRKAGNVTGRDIITLDLDNIPAGGTNDVLRRLDGLGCGYCVYSTRKHHAAAPRLRVLIPIDRTITAEEYEPCARRMAEYLGLELADPTTFEASRLMYWPSCSSDSEYIYLYADKPFVFADGLLATYTDWRDVGSWPALPGTQTFKKLAVKQGDPEAKNGVVGAFCRTYDIHRAMDELLPGIYEPVDTMPGRYTYIGGSTAGGAVIYDGGKFLYSHHATDPCSGKLVNAFDLVRLHKFGDLDDTVQDNHAHNRLPSYVAMQRFAIADEAVKLLMLQEDFADINNEDPSDEEQTTDWLKGLTYDQNGLLHKTINNLMLLIQNAPELNGCANRDDFAGRIYAANGLPWRSENGYWSDPDLTELRRHFETKYKGFRPGKSDVKDAVIAVAVRHRFHPVRDYLNPLVWDGIPRLDTIFIDYLGVADTEYARTVSRKALVGAVERVMVPGCKCDHMLVFIGKQGRGKSSIIHNLAGGYEWFTDSITTFDGQKAYEAVMGKWLVEIPEMQAFDKATMNQAKAFISKQSDFFREAFGTFPEDHRRQCVFFGTTNDVECLRDTTGGRRYWPIETDVIPRTKDVHKDLPQERDQIWAEAVMRWRMGETNYLDERLEKEAGKVQEAHREKHPWEDIIYNYVEQEIPEDWDNWSLHERRSYYESSISQKTEKLHKRDRVCFLQIWCEALKREIGVIPLPEKRIIAGILNRMPDWKRSDSTIRFGKPYGPQKGYTRKVTKDTKLQAP